MADSNTQPPTELAREIVKKISDAAIELSFVRHDLTSDEVIVDGDATVKERVAENEAFMERVKEDTLNCLTGDDFGCLDPEELDATNCELIWLQERLGQSLTVEAALAELREMFPGKVIFLKDEVEWWAGDSEPCRATTVNLDYPPSKQMKFTGDTLDEAMAQVRRWKQENNTK